MKFPIYGKLKNVPKHQPEKKNNSNNYGLWFMVLIAIVTGAYKPTYNWGASHCISGWMTPLSTSRLLGAMLTHLACRCPTAVSVLRTLSKKVGCVYIYITIYIYNYIYI